MKGGRNEGREGGREGKEGKRKGMERKGAKWGGEEEGKGMKSRKIKA